MKHWLTLGTLGLTSMSRLFLSNPRKFIGQVGERLNISILREKAAESQGPTGPDSPQALFDKGQYSQAVAASTGKQQKRLRGELELLTTDGLLEKTLTARGPLPCETKGAVGELRSLHFLTNSLPHTQSGYSLRSHAALASIKAQGVGVRATTRIAYPVTVGQIPRSGVDTIDSISYERLLPPIFPAHLVDRHEKSAKMLIEVAKHHRSNVLHTTTDFRNGLIVHAAAETLGVPWVYEARGEMEKTWLSRFPQEQQEEAGQSEFYRLARAQEARVAGSAHGVVALSEISAQQLIERGVQASRITVVPNAVDDALLTRHIDRDRLRAELGLPGGLVVGAITAVVGYEGLDTLISSIHSLPRDARILIVGDGTARPELEKLAKDLKVEDRVIFAGRKPAEDIWRWYGVLDVFAVPRHDTAVARTVTPIKPLNALALGVPVVTSDLPALREVTGSVSTYSTAGDPEDLARAIVEASTADPAPGKEFASTRTWSANGKRYKELYERVSADYTGRFSG